MGTAIPLIAFNEPMVGANDPSAADTLNRALLAVIAASNGSATSFVGFSLVGHTHQTADITNLNLAGFLPLAGGPMTGPIKGKGYIPNVNQQSLSSTGTVNYTAVATDEIIAFPSLSGACTVTLPKASTANVIILADIFGAITGGATIGVNVQGGDTGIFPGGTSVLLSTQWGSWQFVSDGASKWSLLGVLRNNSTTSNPAVGNDNTQGYTPGSLWNNITAKTLYMCTDNTTGAAVWTQISSVGGGSAGGDLAGTYPNPTLAGTAPAIGPAPTALTDGATITWATAGARTLNAKVTIAGNRTLAFTGAVAGAAGILAVTQDATGSRTLTLPAGSKVVNGGAGGVSLSTTPGATDFLSFYYDGTNFFWTVALNFT